MKLYDKIAKLRKRKGLSQEELANELEVSRQSVFKWESGENTPDLDKIKKIAKLFNVSFDVLLDDEKDIDEVDEKATQASSVKKPFSYRKTFNSGIKLKTSELANLENGFANGKKRIEKYSFEATSKHHKELIRKKNYTKIIRIQSDICVDFFIDESNKTFGFFFEGAPQFLCPFENFASFAVVSSGPGMGYTRTPVVGVGLGANPSIGVGSMPVAQGRLPLWYDCTISYFDEKGFLKDYKIGFGCNRVYVTYDGTINTTDELFLWENMISNGTNKNLSEISVYLNGIKDLGQKIKDGEISVPPVDVTALPEEVKAGQDRKKRVIEAFNLEIEKSRKRKKKGLLIAFLVIATIVAGTVTTCSIVKAVEKNQVVEVNKNKAQKVIDLIDAIGEVTLSSGSDISRAEYAYNALTNEQKAYVTNYKKLVAAREKYDRLVYEQREEETKDDPTRTIVVTDLNGRWESSYDEWAIANLNGGTAVLYWTSGSLAGVISGNLQSSYLVGYNNETRKMGIKLYHYTIMGGEYLDVTMTKSSTKELTLYYKNQTFHKTSN